MSVMSAGALTLGAGHGKVVLGSPLDVTFNVQVDSERHLEDTCLSAHVRMGENPLAEDHVNVSLVSPQSILPRVRVRTNVPVDEPVVVVRLQATCGGSISRVYTFLSELPGEVRGGALGAAASGQQRGEAALVDRNDQPVVQNRSSAPKRTAGRSLDVVQADKSRVKPSLHPKRPEPPAKRRSSLQPLAKTPPVADDARQMSAPRLVMEPLDTWIETPPELRLAIDLPRFGEAGTASPSSKDAAKAWKILNASPQELANLSTRAGEAEKEVQTAREQLASERAHGLELQRQLQVLTSQRFSASVVYGLAGLLAAALLLLAWQAWHRRRADEEAWRQSVALNAEELSADGLSDDVGATVWPRTQAPDEPAVGVTLQAPAPHPPSALRTELADDVVTMPAEPPVALAESAPPPALRAKEIEHPEDLFDVLQQADFFISIGEHEQAVDSLRRHIAQHPTSSPLAYLELLRLYHTLGRVAAFDELRGGFEDQFNAQVPPFATFQRGGRSLEDYDEDLARIESLWGSEQVLDELDRLMFHRESGHGVARFDLPAYEDLLLLWAIAQSFLAKSRAAPAAAVPKASTMVTSSVKMGGRSVDTLAGDLVLEPSQPVPILGAVAERSAVDGSALPQIVAPDPVPDPDELQLSLAPRDSGRRGIK